MGGKAQFARFGNPAPPLVWFRTPEGAAAEDGKERSIWDTFSERPNATLDGSTPRRTCDHYHRYADDLKLMHDLGLRNYRFSIAWPQAIQNGAANETGLFFYDRLVDAMLEQGIEPYATLFHWDLPQRLQDPGGFANRETVKRYVEHVDVVSRKPGNRVHRWKTFNEPWVYAFVGHL
ncbi:MAG TPA: family 1 glycosylhydrolase [Spirochaetia bacterium]|nr:family 1 glycosylhydrolase [Spirochaetia bacterium]